MTTDLDDFAFHAPASVNVETLSGFLQALSPEYDVNRWRLPLPPWAQRPYDDSGARAWDTLLTDLAAEQSAPAMCIYIHVPFCDAKCGFCDSYSFRLGARIPETAAAYVERLRCELALWGRLPGLRGRPVSTVHLGGGTPTFLGERLLTRLVESCREVFATSESTEWALEATASSLTPSMIAALDSLGFRRLHVGIQSLEDPVRLMIGRRGGASDVLARVEAALAAGWVVSVDLLCGLPGQTIAGFIDGIETLIRVGVDGFSIYELLIYPQNRRWAASHGLIDRKHVANYLTFLSGAQVLERHGYEKNLFNHWAGRRDANVYFTFPTRDEDCLAVGAIADGVFGDYHYRHPKYAPYIETTGSDFPGLEGGLRRTARENSARPLVTALLSGHIDETLVGAFATAEGGSLIEKWQANGLMEPDLRGGVRLTASGAWFTGNLIAEIDTQPG